jgi:multiple sugar transport system ATP-binding protein
MCEVILKNVTKIFGKDNLVIEDVNLKIKDKEFFTIVGPSGCGKSTILNMIAGLEEVSVGEIIFDQQMVNDLPPARRDVAFVFQSYALYPHKNVFDNIAFPLKIRKLAKREIKERVKKTASILEIEHLLSRKPKELSGGQRQRVALGRAIVRKPKVFLLDEPLSNLDAKLRVYMRAELKKLHKEIQTTMIYVTHDQAEAMTLSDRVAILFEGKVQQCDSPQMVYNFPANRIVAEFIGSPSMNFFEGRLVSEDDRTSVRFTDQDSFPLGGGKELDLSAIGDTPAGGQGSVYDRKDNEVIFGVRPEDVIISLEEKSAGSIGQDWFLGKIFALEPLGNATYVDIQWNMNRLKAEANPDFEAEPDSPIYFTFKKEKIHLFNRTDGKRLTFSSL